MPPMVPSLAILPQTHYPGPGRPWISPHQVTMPVQPGSTWPLQPQTTTPLPPPTWPQIPHVETSSGRMPLPLPRPIPYQMPPCIAASAPLANAVRPQLPPMAYEIVTEGDTQFVRENATRQERRLKRYASGGASDWQLFTTVTGAHYVASPLFLNVLPSIMVQSLFGDTPFFGEEVTGEAEVEPGDEVQLGAVVPGEEVEPGAVVGAPEDSQCSTPRARNKP